MVIIISRVVWWCEDVVYLTSPGRPTDIGLQLGKACYGLGLGLGLNPQTVAKLSTLLR